MVGGAGHSEPTVENGGRENEHRHQRQAKKEGPLVTISITQVFFSGTKSSIYLEGGHINSP